jgi:lipoprotein-anchoring transpeptidase ErfK/SrfK
VWLPYASYFNGGIAFHGYDEVPAWPVSHGCVRLSAPEAPFVYEFAAIGTPVLVY